MRKTASLLIALLLALLLLGVGAAGYLWYSVKKQADALVALAQPFAQVSYSGIDLKLEGAIGVKNVRITPLATGNTIQAGAIRLHAPNLLALLRAMWELRRNRLPQGLAVTFDNMQIHLGDLASAGADPKAAAGPFDHLDALGCGSVTAFGAADWQAMGYERLTGTLDMGYRMHPQQNLLELRMDSNTQNMTAVHLSASLALSDLADSSPTLALASFTPKLAKLDLTLNDQGLNPRRNTYCAAKSGQAVLDYIASHVQLLNERLRANGLLLGSGWLSAYQRYLTEGGALELTARPPIPINPTELPEYAPADQAKVLGLNLNVNQTPTTDLAINWNAAQLAAALGVASSASGPSQRELETAADAAAAARAEAAAAAAAAQRAAQVKAYHPTPANQLTQHAGKLARLRTRAGTQYQGELHPPTAEGQIRITVRRSGGRATFSLRPEEITSAEVLY